MFLSSFFLLGSVSFLVSTASRRGYAVGSSPSSGPIASRCRLDESGVSTAAACTTDSLERLHSFASSSGFFISFLGWCGGKAATRAYAGRTKVRPVMVRVLVEYNCVFRICSEKLAARSLCSRPKILTRFKNLKRGRYKPPGSGTVVTSRQRPSRHVTPRSPESSTLSALSSPRSSHL